MAKKNSNQAPTPSACPECGTQRVLSEGINTLRVHKVNAQFVPGITHSDSEFWALVCPECGHSTLYAKDPQHLQK
jgi:predicted RNA-binding Zn-ribbon protein involved in translation (DUF1610 family)